MAFRKIYIIIYSLLFTSSVFAQTSDTLHHVDSIHKTPFAITDTAIRDTAVHISADTVRKTVDTVAATLRKSPQSEGYVINGKVEDRNTSEGIPFAIILFPHSQLGTAADLEGNFIIKTDKLPNDTLHIQALGYTPVNKILKKTQHNYNYIIEMGRSETSLNEVVVHAGEDPAVLLMRKIIARKPFNNPDRTENYKYEAYNRLEADLQRLTRSQFDKLPILKHYSFIFDNIDTSSDTRPFLPLYLTETLSDYYFRQHPKKQREFIKASMVKGVNNQNVVKYLGSLYQNVNVYRNYIPVFDKKFISPISNDGLFYYKYTIKDTEKAYGHNIILVQFSPRRPGENCFTGDSFQHIGILSLEFHVDKLSRPLL